MSKDALPAIERILFTEAQIAQRINEERGTAADFIAEQGNAGAGVVVGFDDDVLEFVTQILLDGRFVLFFDFGEIREHSDGVKAFAGTAFVGGE